MWGDTSGDEDSSSDDEDEYMSDVFEASDLAAAGGNTGVWTADWSDSGTMIAHLGIPCFYNRT